MWSHYVDIAVQDLQLHREVHSRMVSLVHRHIARGARLALAWPWMTPQPGRFGQILRVFGSHEDLAALGEAMEPLRVRHLIEAQPVRPVPTGVQTWAVYAKHTRSQRGDMARIRRHKAKLEERGGVWEDRPRPARGSHWLKLQSGSTGQTYPLYIERREGEPGETPLTSNGTQFGLNYWVPDF